MRPGNKHIIFFLSVLLLISVAIGLISGPAKIPVGQLLSGSFIDIVYLRLLRVLLALVAGAGLGVCGVVLQGLLRNPLAEPYILGTSSGAGLGAVVALLFGWAAFLVPLTAFIGALVSLAAVYYLARSHGKLDIYTMVLSGVIVSILLSGLMIFLIFISPNEALRGIMGWLLGSLQIFDAGSLVFVALVVVIGTIILWIFSRDLNAIALGEDEALHLGIDIEITKTILFVLTALMTASIVCLCGLIGFVGLIIPHIMRLAVGSNHRILIPASALAAASFLILCDTLSRSVFISVEIPIDVMTALIGAPLFIILLRTKKRIIAK